MKSIFDSVKITVENIQVADNAYLTGGAIDMSGYEGVAFLAVVGSIEEGGYTMKAQQDTTSGFSSAADLEGSAILFTSTTAGPVSSLLDVGQPQERYVRACLTVPNLTSTIQAVSIVAIQYNGRTLPVSQSNAEFHAYPAEGTA